MLYSTSTKHCYRWNTNQLSQRMPIPPDMNVIVSPCPLVDNVDWVLLLLDTEVTAGGQGSAVGLNPDDMETCVESGYCTCSEVDCQDRWKPPICCWGGQKSVGGERIPLPVGDE